MAKEIIVQRVNLDSDIADKYPSESSVKTTLERFAPYWSEQKPLIITDAQRRELEVIMARNFNTSEELITHIKRICELNIEGFTISLDARLLGRLKSRAMSMDFQKFLQFIVKRFLEEHAGLR